MAAKKRSTAKKVEKFVVLNKIDPLSVAKLEGIIGVVVGLILGVIFASFGVMSGLYPSESAMFANSMFANLGVVGIIVLPIFYGVTMFLAGLIGAWIYNLIASWVGGVKLQLE